MTPSRIAVCTTTMYPKWVPGEADFDALLAAGDRAAAESKIRGDLALETAMAVQRAGYRLVLVDGAKDGVFQAELARRGIPFHQEAGRGMSASRRQAFTAAYEDPDTRAVVWMEPEKVGMVGEIGHSAEPVLDGSAAMVIPARTQAGWDSLPGYQRESEAQANTVFNDKLRRAGLLQEGEADLDLYFGNRVMSALGKLRGRLQEILGRRYAFEKRSAVPLHAAVNPGAYSEATFFPPVAALAEGLTVRSVDTAFAYPELQRRLEEHPGFADGDQGYRAKRRTQQVGILTEFVHYLRAIRPGSGGKSRLSAQE